LPPAKKLWGHFGLKSFTLVGDRGTIAGTHHDALRAAGADWVTALKSDGLKKLVDGVI